MNISLNNAQELPHPTWNRICELDSDQAKVTHAGLIHIFKLPKIGEYLYDFKVYSNLIINNQSYVNHSYSPDISQPNYGMNIMEMGSDNTHTHNHTHTRVVYQTDCILNYIESVSLCLDTPENVLSQINQFQDITQIADVDMVNILGNNLDFLTDSPLISASLCNSDIYILFKFKKKPSQKYYLAYSTGFVENPEAQSHFINSTISFPTTVNHNGTYRQINVRYQNGKLDIY